MKRISILSILLLLFFSCKQYGDVKSLTEVATDLKDDNSLASGGVGPKDQITKKGPALTSEESEKLEALKTFLQDAIGVNGRDKDLKAEYEKSYKEFFDWLSKDVNRQKEFVSSFNKICDIVAKAVDASKQRTRDDQRSLGFNEYVCYKIKKSTGESLSLFFQKVADAFGTEEYKRKDDANSQKPEKCNEEIFKVIKRVFTESENNKELADLKYYGNI
ncbi:hypothetical protein BLA33_04415 (plasmid) [Borreliella garinii]|uniref:hypothetical protein n=1 Tax=Borreliella garinii TaxID=29519 RepID=UPI0004112DE3|nr:hypothetical protein [Borreliella garinii]APQ15596.1 hypothetical protein BLA33_04415 [Borreliella garinii]AZA28313.1 hypothetical protein DB281_04485 [Borreliella garinii]